VRKKRILLSIMLGLAFLGVYLGAIRRIIHERNERSLELRDNVSIADCVLISVSVIRVDPTTRQLTVRFRLQPAGNIAQDPATPKVDLRFLVNNSPGQQIFEFRKGETLSRIEATLRWRGTLTGILSIATRPTYGSSSTRLVSPRGPKFLYSCLHRLTCPQHLQCRQRPPRLQLLLRLQFFRLLPTSRTSRPQKS